MKGKMPGKSLRKKRNCISLRRAVSVLHVIFSCRALNVRRCVSLCFRPPAPIREHKTKPDPERETCDREQQLRRRTLKAETDAHPPPLPLASSPTQLRPRVCRQKPKCVSHSPALRWLQPSARAGISPAVASPSRIAIDCGDPAAFRAGQQVLRHPNSTAEACAVRGVAAGRSTVGSRSFAQILVPDCPSRSPAVLLQRASSHTYQILIY